MKLIFVYSRILTTVYEVLYAEQTRNTYRFGIHLVEHDNFEAFVFAPVKKPHFLTCSLEKILCFHRLVLVVNIGLCLLIISQFASHSSLELTQAVINNTQM